VPLIAGLVEWQFSDSLAERVRRMLGYRLPPSIDGVRIEATNNCAFGVGGLVGVGTNRETSAGGPLFSSGLLSAVDGRFDNLAAIQSELGLPPASDVELISSGYRQWGTDLFRRLKGEYAIAIWNPETMTLIAGRDPFSIRPLYYSISSTRVLLASDPEQILASGVVPPIPDDQSVVDYLLWDFRSVERSFFRDISRLPGGHFMVARKDGCKVSEFRRPIISSARHSDRQEFEADFRRLFRQAVKRRLHSNSPVGAHLSGGLDSSSIVCVADDLVLENPAICPGFFAAAALHPGLDCDEETFIRAVQSRLHVDVESWDGTLADSRELAASPCGLPGATFAMTGGTEGDVEIAKRRGASVLLSGIGGDQIGIPTGALEDAIAEIRLLDAWRIVSGAPGASISSVLRTGARMAKSAAPLWLRAIHDGLRQNSQAGPAWLTSWAREYADRPALAAHRGGPGTNLQQRRWQDLTSPRTVLSIEYVQNHALRHDIEMRFPFFDADLTAFVLGVPAQFWPPPWPQERLHREPLKGVLPAEIVLRRTKANFSSALTNRVRRQLKFIGELFTSKKWESERYVKQDGAREALAEFERSRNPPFALTYSVWAIASLEAWLQRVFRYATVLPWEVTNVRVGESR
jgi:asparagine synthase (glutamine-hydrolysing)